MKLKLKAYAPNREPQLGICDVRRIDFEFGKVTISNGQVTNVLNLDEVELMLYTGHKDDHGNEIYSGHRIWIEVHNFSSGGVIASAEEVVIFQNGQFGVLWGFDRDFTPLSGFSNNVTFEIVGHKWESGKEAQADV